jgi:Holliday junction DNA helicase RuvB
MTSAPARNPLLDPQIPDEVSSLRPKRLSDFIGQDQLCHNLKVCIDASKARGDVLDHVLFYGPPGLGKTTLAQIVAHEREVGFKATSGPLLTKSGDLAAILTNLQAHDVLFIDEIHRLPVQVEEVLYAAMEDFQLDIVLGEGPSARTLRIDLQPFTLVGATTRSGLLTNPLRDRFGILCRLEFYEPQDLCRIVQRAASKWDLSMHPEAAMAVARRSRGTPRIAGRLMRRIRDFYTLSGHPHLTADHVDETLRALDVDDLGLDAFDRRYLSTIAVHYQGGPVGIETLAAALGEAKDTLEDVIEPFLIQQGLIQRTPRGRMLADAAFRHLGLGPV